MSNERIPRPSWRIRRTIIVASLIFCAFWLGYLILHGTDTRLEETIAQGLLLLAGSVIGSYVFGAVWDDRNVIQAEAQIQAAERDHAG